MKYFCRLGITIFQLLFLVTSGGFTYQMEGPDFSAYDMINAVNNIRSSQGLAPVQINSTLMAVAQDQSEYQAFMQKSSHSGRSGGIVNDRVAASGYGAGETFVAGENVANLDLGISNMLSIIMNEIWADPVHRGAMVNPKYHDIGVGIASDGKSVYVTLNLAGIVEKSTPPPSQSSMSLTADPQTDAGIPAIQPLVTCTPLSDGSIYHIVGYGQTLGTIARIYEVEVDELVRLNHIEPDMIYAGQKLWIKKITMTTTVQATVESVSPTGTPIPTLEPSQTSLPTETATAIATSTTSPVNTREIGIPVIFGLFILALVFFLLTRFKASSQS